MNPPIVKKLVMKAINFFFIMIVVPKFASISMYLICTIISVSHSVSMCLHQLNVFVSLALVAVEISISLVS